MAELIVAAGGTGGHIFPALAFALEARQELPKVTLRWIGTRRSREQELCSAHAIPIELLDVTGISRSLSPAAIGSLLRFVKSTVRLKSLFAQNRPLAVVAFGGYVCAPVMAAATLSKVPIYIQEQNTVPGLVNRFFASRARCSFLGFPLIGRFQMKGTTVVTGTPVRPRPSTFAPDAYPHEIDSAAKTILICGGSQGALTMNRLLVDAVRSWAGEGLQIVWQTGTSGFGEITQATKECPSVHCYETIKDLYPYYALARVVLGRAGASTLSEAALFGLPFVAIPLPWSAENHQWINAGLAQDQGWGIRLDQNTLTTDQVRNVVKPIIEDDSIFLSIREKALTHSPAGAARTMTQRIREDLHL